MTSVTNEVLHEQSLQVLVGGRTIPPLYKADIAKRIFDPEEHTDRVNYLFRHIAKDDSLDVLAGLSTVSDLPTWFEHTNVYWEMRKKQFLLNSILTKEEMLTMPMLLLQYAPKPSYPNETTVIVLMAESTKAFQEFDKESERYIHRTAAKTSDTGMSVWMGLNMIYVQLDKCLEQFKAGRNGEAEDGKSDELQLWLSVIADANDRKVLDAAAQNACLTQIISEALSIAQA